MKRIFSFILLLVATLSISITAYASSSKTYILDDLGMTIDIPSECVVFTRNISDDDPDLSMYGLNKKDFSDLMESRNIYLNAWDDAVNFEIVVTMIESTINDFNLLSDTTLNALASSFKTEYANKGVLVEKHEIYQHDQAKFIKIFFNQPNDTDEVYGLQYYTVYDNKTINVTMHSYSGIIDSAKETILQSIVSTVHFDKAPMLPEAVAETDAFVYKDKETGSEFTVPANWSQKPLSQDREVLDVKFSSNKEPGLSILYGSSDIWAEMSSSEKKGASRSDINNSLFTIDEIAETMGVSKSKISTVSYGGEEYYKSVNTEASSSYGINLEVTLTCLMRFENGYAYMFQFPGDSTNAYYKDFESLLESVKYPAVENTSSPDLFSKFSVANILLSLLITIAVYSVPIIIYRHGILKKPVEKAKAKKITIIYGVIAFIVMSVLIFVINGSGAAGGAILLWSWVNYKILTGGREPVAEDTAVEIPQTVSLVNDPSKATVESERTIGISSLSETPTKSQDESVEDDIVFCYKCGTKLSANAQFCHKCGTKVAK